MTLTNQQVYGKLHDCQQAIAPMGFITAILKFCCCLNPRGESKAVSALPKKLRTSK
ncbi:MAG: hypothetical protein EBE86_029630 [Hormoscilla sp. GUM202]|nr:hypothetical protein [Hormoscilla sp. GUM202]